MLWFASEKPYVYYENNTYTYNFGELPTLRNNNLFIWRMGSSLSSTMIPAPRPYLSTQSLDPPDAKQKASFASADTFQIISAGLDNDYGPMVSNTPPAYYVYAFPKGPYPEKAQSNNITNFSSGPIGNSVP